MVRSASRLSTVLVGLIFLALAPVAQADTMADTMMDLVRELGAQPPGSGGNAGDNPGVVRAATAVPRCRARKVVRVRRLRRHRVRVRREPSHQPPPARHAALGRTARPPRSGRIDIIDASGPVSSDDRPAIAVKTGL